MSVACVLWWYNNPHAFSKCLAGKLENTANFKSFVFVATSCGWIPSRVQTCFWEVDYLSVTLPKPSPPCLCVVLTIVTQDHRTTFLYLRCVGGFLCKTWDQTINSTERINIYASFNEGASPRTESTTNPNMHKFWYSTVSWTCTLHPVFIDRRSNRTLITTTR